MTTSPDTLASGRIDGQPGVARLAGLARLERFVLPALLAMAALLRFPGLAGRGTWDGDQGHDMLVLRALVQDGVIPLLGPPTSIGDVHHGAWYYYLLSPAAALTGGDSPLAVVALIALAGVAAVGVVWWLARAIGGPLAGAVAGLVLATATAAIDGSTFIWNPNLIALSSVVALAGAWRAWAGGDPRWWLLSAVGAAVTMQCHVLGVAVLPIVAVPFLLDGRRRSLGLVTLGVLAVLVVSFLPLIVNELTTGFSETRAALDYLAGGRGSDVPALPVRFGVIGLRVVSWPLVGLIAAAFVPATIATATIAAIGVWLARRLGDGAGHADRHADPGFVRGADHGNRADPSHDQDDDARDRLLIPRAARWLGLGLLWSIAFLTVAAPNLSAVVPGLPNDHYHAFADPLVVVLLGLGVAAMARTRVGPASARPAVARVAGVVGVGALLSWNLTHLPPAVHPDGGYPAGQAAGDRVVTALRDAGVQETDVVLVRSLPDFKSTEAVAYPLVRAGQSVVAETPRDPAPGSEPGSRAEDAAAAVLLCDDLFRDALAGACGGPAEDAAAESFGWDDRLDRFEAHPGRWVSVYAVMP